MKYSICTDVHIQIIDDIIIVPYGIMKRNNYNDCHVYHINCAK